MANDRVFIKCSCGCWKMLLKYYPGPGLYPTGNAILEWLDTHGHCHPNDYAGNLGDNPGFTLHTENAFDDGTLSMDKQNMTPDGKQINGPKDINPSPGGTNEAL